MAIDQHQVIVCPLDWGLGHASRMIPIIKRYMECGYRVIVGGSGRSGILLKLTFPDLPFITVPSPIIRYSKKGIWLLPALILQLPAMLFSIIREHLLVKKIVIAHGVDIIVSDNRYGLYCKRAHSILITHQVSPVLPALLRWAEYPLYLVIRTIILKFNECWIPDNADPHYNLSGKLSHRFKLPGNARFVGILSRFNQNFFSKQRNYHERYKLVVVLSGPEPQISTFKDILTRQALNIPHKILIISGFCGNQNPLPENDCSQIKIVSHMESEEFGHALLQADIIICRSGYSGIMDLVALRKTAILVPTPGQTEQQYLASYLFKKGWFSYVTQHELSLDNILRNKKNTAPPDRLSLTDKDELPIKQVSYFKNRNHSYKSQQKT